MQEAANYIWQNRFELQSSHNKVFLLLPRSQSHQFTPLNVNQELT